MAAKTHREIIDGWYPYTEQEINTYVSRGIWHDVTICDLLDRNAEAVPDKLAMADEKVELTWRELVERSNRLAIHLKRMGVESGDFFVLQVPNVVELFYLYFGLNRIGAIPVMCIPRHRKLELDYQIGLHKAKGVVAPVGERFDYVSVLDEVRGSHPYLQIFLIVGGAAPEGWLSIDQLLEDEIEKNHPGDYPQGFKPDPNDICVAQLSGGTTGVPKSIPRTHNDYICQWDYHGRSAAITDDSVVLVTTPAAHNAAITSILGPAVFRGATVILTKSFRPEDNFRLIEKYRVTHVLLIPVQIGGWMEAEEARKKYDLSSLKIIASGAQKVRPEIVRWCMYELGVNFVNGFGMAEGPLIATRWDDAFEIHASTVGRPVVVDPTVEIKLVDDDGKEVKQGEIGEMIMRGPLTFKGYFRSPVENAKSFDEEGFLHSGDLMSFTPDGRCVVEGRKKDMIKRGGENVYPEPVEDLLAKYSKVLNAAAIGMPDAKLGEKLCAFVQPREGQTTSLEEVQQYLKEQGMATFQWPERLEVVQGWPLTAVNKIDKRLLRAHITAKLVEEGQINKELGNEYLQRDKLTIDDILTGKVKIDFARTPS